MPELGHRRRHLFQIALFRLAINAHDTLRLGKGQTAQEKILYQTKDRGVHADAQREREHGKQRERRRFAELAKSETNVV